MLLEARLRLDAREALGLLDAELLGAEAVLLRVERALLGLLSLALLALRVVADLALGVELGLLLRFLLRLDVVVFLLDAIVFDLSKLAE